MNRTELIDAPVGTLEQRFSVGSAAQHWAALVGQIGADEAARLVSTIAKIDPPVRIAALSEIERRQAEWGAGFCGLLPDQMTEPLLPPDTDERLLTVALRLEEIRRRNTSPRSGPRCPGTLCRSVGIPSRPRNVVSRTVGPSSSNSRGSRPS